MNQPITLHLDHIPNRASDAQLESFGCLVKREFGEQDIEFYDKYGWENFREENLIERKLPELGPALYFNNKPILEIKGKRYEVEFYEDDYHQCYEPDGKEIILTPTDKPLSEPLKSGYFQFFGQPHWIQNDHYPLDKNGNLCYNLLTIDNRWGDNGNYNILIGFDENDVPNVAYFEASCH